MKAEPSLSPVVATAADPVLQVYLLGSVDFEAALALQHRLVFDIASNRSTSVLILCQHPPLITVGRHFLWVDSMALSDTVRITAVAPADTVRWVRFYPNGLQFRTNGAGWSALLYTSFKDCGVPTADTLRIAQVTDSLNIIRYLAPPDSTWIRVRKKVWSKGNQYVAGVLHHFSQYAVSW